MADRSKGQSGDLVNQHKRLAMGEKVTGMKKGGAVKKAKGGCMNKGGKVVKKK